MNRSRSADSLYSLSARTQTSQRADEPSALQMNPFWEFCQGLGDLVGLTRPFRPSYHIGGFQPWAVERAMRCVNAKPRLATDD
jgi:hypothetical protein